MKINPDLEKFRIKESELLFYGQIGDSFNGVFKIEYEHRKYTVIASNGGGWEHVSVSGKNIPSWKVMCYIKNLFWAENETVVQYHPPKSEYVNNCDTCLHLWKKIGSEFELPPSIYVGIKEGDIESEKDCLLR